MINEETKKAVTALHSRGTNISSIAELLGIDRKTVRIIINGSKTERKKRTDNISIDENLLKEVFKNCDEYVQRTFEVLKEEHNVSIGYSTLTRLLRKSGLNAKLKPQAFQVPDVPGEEMQHDTSPYQILLDGKKTKIICSGLYLRYSKMRYIKFFHSFNRFKMKCFLHEALTHWGYAAKMCIIDNTNLAVFSGSGGRAVFSREMESFAHQYGFTWKAHAIRHSNRKAGTERNFYTVETNFFPGRTFKSIEDLNKQAFEWSTQRWSKRPLAKTKLIPIELFEIEKSTLIKIPDGIHKPCLPHPRTIDQYGYVSFGANYYYTHKEARGVIQVLEYDENIRICLERITNGKCSDIEYVLPPWKTKNQKYFPPGVKKPAYEPKNLKQTSDNEQKYLQNLHPVCVEYLNFVFSKNCLVVQKYKFIRDLYFFSRKITLELFVLTLSRALHFQVADIGALSNIARQILQIESHTLPPTPDVGDYQSRQSYLEGQFSNEEFVTEHLKKIMDETGTDEINNDEDNDGTK